MITEGRFTRYKNSKSYAATVELELSPSTGGTSITVQTDGQGFTSQGYIEEAPHNGYSHWKNGAVAGGGVRPENVRKPPVHGGDHPNSGCTYGH